MDYLGRLLYSAWVAGSLSNDERLNIGSETRTSMVSHAARNISLEEMDKQSFFHPYTPLDIHMKTGPKIIASGKGIRVTDNHGKEYIDSMAGLWCVNVGYGRDEVADAAHAQLKKLAYYHSFASVANEPAIRLADRLIELVPDRLKMSKVLFGNTGSDANDTNIKLVWYYQNVRGKPKKKKIISRKRGYHGVTIIAGGLSGLDALHTGFDLPLARVVYAETPYPYREAPEGMSGRDYARHLAKKLDEQIQAEDPETVAAMICEPVMGAGGVIVPPEGYFEEIQKVLKKHDVLLIADEVICGFGRTGAWFGSETLDITPDLMTCAKGLTSGYIPMSASIVSERVWETILEAAPRMGPFGHGYTYCAHPVAAAAGLANLAIIERENLVGNAAKVGAYMQKRLRESFADHPLVGEVRGVGLVAGVEVVKNKASREEFPLALKVGPRIVAKAYEEGLITRSLVQTSTLAFSPPLVITEAEVDQIVERFGKALDKAAGELAKESLWKAA